MRVRLAVAFFAAAALLVPIAVQSAPAVAASKAKCDTPDHPGGDWASYGRDLSNTRTQSAEKKIGTDNVVNLAPAWATSVTEVGAAGGFQSNPIVAEGCVFLTTNAGWIFALNADTGELVWKTSESGAQGSLGGLFAPTVVDGVLYVNMDVPEKPYAAAFDAATGKVLWKSEPATKEKTSFTNSSAVVFDGLMFMGISGAEGGGARPGGYAIFDADNGQLLVREHSVPDKDFKKGYAGGSIWATAVVDEQAGYLYVGTGQPASPQKEHQHTNAIVKIDVDRSRATFGEIVDAYKGVPETYVPGLQNQPLCQQFGADAPAAGPCLNQDIDFGASPNLFRDDRGNLMVGEYQKAGVYHAVYAENMQEAWTAILSPLLGPAYLANAASTAFDGTNIIGVGSFPGQMIALNRSTGGYTWAAPVADGVQYNPISTANGVAYTTDTKGFLDAFDAATGVPLLARPMSADIGGDACANLAGGSAIARNTVYAICDTGAAGSGWIIAYQVP